MPQRIADKDIVETNHLGQNVVIAAAGQPIPDWYQEDKKPAAKKVDKPAENKARSTTAKKRG